MTHHRLKFAVVCGVFVLCVIPPAAYAEPGEPKADWRFPDGTEVYFLSGEAAADAIVDDAMDPFFDRLTLLDIKFRYGHELDSDNLKAEQQKFRTFVRGCVRDWSPSEKEAQLSTLKSVHAHCTTVVPALIPKKWRFVKTNGKVDGAPHTRGSTIVLPQSLVSAGVSEHTVIHETFHVYSRLNPKIRTRLYEAVGFRPVSGATLPPSLEARRLTNPDGADFAFAIDVKDRTGRAIKILPLVYAKQEELFEDGGSFFRYVTFGLFEVQNKSGSWRVVADDQGQATPLAPHMVRGYFEQIGQNTHYIIHPDEILADNVTLLIRSRTGDKSAQVRSPGILKKIEHVLGAN